MWCHSAGEFVRLATPIVIDILSRGKYPVIVGGCTMWVQWLVRGVRNRIQCCPYDLIEYASELYDTVLHGLQVPDAPKADAAVSQEADALLSPFKNDGDLYDCFHYSTEQLNDI